MQRYWISWWSILGGIDTPFKSWITGEDDRGRASYCALVDAPSDIDARLTVQRSFFDADFRFSEPQPPGWSESDRFP